MFIYGRAVRVRNFHLCLHLLRPANAANAHEANACLTQPGANSFRLRLAGKLDVGRKWTEHFALTQIDALVQCQLGKGLKVLP